VFLALQSLPCASPSIRIVSEEDLNGKTKGTFPSYPAAGIFKRGEAKTSRNKQTVDIQFQRRLKS
jgi:hypothetical protein